MSELTFVFGPNNSFFFDCPKAWKFYNLPQTLWQLFQSYMSPEWHIAQPYCLALAPAYNSPEPIWYIGCKVVNGEDKIFHSQQFFEQNYPDLSKWTKLVPNSARVCRVTFGSTPLSYFACAPGYGSTWMNVPSELTDKVQKGIDTPACVSLGAFDAWFVMWPDGYFAWKFYGKYEALDAILKEARPQSISYLAISPYNSKHYFVAFKDGSIKYDFVGVPEWTAPIQDIFNQWHAEVMQRQRMQQPYGQPFYNSPMQTQWNPYSGMPTPPPAQQQMYAAAHYANAHSPPPGMPQYNPYANTPMSPPPVEMPVEMPGTMVPPQVIVPPQPQAMELPGDTLLPQRPESIAVQSPGSSFLGRPSASSGRPSISNEKKRKSFFAKAFRFT